MIRSSDDMDPKSQDVSFPLDRITLFDLVWSMPMTALAEKCGVSSSYLARVCTQMSVPRPERGYWAKLAVGKKVTKPSLPAPGPEDMLEWSKGEGITPSSNRRIRRPDITQHPRTIRRARGSWHPLLRDVKELFLKGRETENGYLKPHKKILPDLLVSSEGLEKLLKLANNLYWSFEEKGHRVTFEPKHSNLLRRSPEKYIEPEALNSYTNYWSPYRSTLIYVGEVAIGLKLIELSESVECVYDSSTHQYIRVNKKQQNVYKYSWTTKQNIPAGKFVVIAYSPYPGTEWEKLWHTGVRKRREIIENITSETIASAPTICKLHDEAVERAEKRRRECEIKRQEYKRAEQARLRLKAIEDSTSQLKDIIDKWDEVERIKGFFDQAEHVVSGLDVTQRNELMIRIDAARQMIGENNALNSLKSWRTPEELMDELKTTHSSWFYDD